MGVRGLTTFMAANPHLFSDKRLHDCCVVIDGNNLCHYLYHLYKVDSCLGGDYSFFYAKVVQYLESFRKCNILTYLVFDGAYDPSDSKLATTMSRAKQRLAAAKQLTRNVFGRKVLPILALDVLRDALIALKLPHAYSDFEADAQIVALANYLECPVLSLDSDFYIYDIVHGFVPLDRLDSGLHRPKKKSSSSEEDVNYTYMSCQLYSIDRFLKCFDNLDRSKLPLLAAIVGNDNVDYEATLAFFKAVTLPRKVDSRLTFTSTQKPILGLLGWLQRSTAEVAVEKMVTFLKGDLKSKTREALLRALSAYNLCSSSLIRHLRLDRNSTNNQSSPTFTLVTKCGSVVPKWCRSLIQSGAFPPFFLNVLANRRVFLLAQVEHWGRSSSYDCSCRLRQVLYGILLADDSAAATKNASITADVSFDVATMESSHQGPAAAPVTEYGRRGRNFGYDNVEPLVSLDQFGRLPGLTALPSIPRQKSVDLLLEVLGIDIGFIQATSPAPDWSLFVSGIVYWLRSSKSTIRSEIRRFVASLVVTGLHTTLTATYKKTPRRRRKIPEAASNDVSDYSEDGDAVELDGQLAESSIPKVFETLTATTDNYHDCLADLSAKYQRDPVIDRNHPPNLRGLHWYAELQTCFLFASYLNRLLRCPLPNFGAAHFLNGIFLYNVFDDLGARSNLDDYLGLLFAKSLPMRDLFLMLRETIIAGAVSSETPVSGDESEDDDFEEVTVVDRIKIKQRRRKIKKRGRRRR